MPAQRPHPELETPLSFEVERACRNEVEGVMDDESVACSISKEQKAGSDASAQFENEGDKELKEVKFIATKAASPVNVERQCGVLLSNGQMCARNLKCKSHGMGAKRAVRGRSMPYDMLLAITQEKTAAAM